MPWKDTKNYLSWTATRIQPTIYGRGGQIHTAFYTPHGLYCYVRMPFGLRNAGATYQRMVDAIFRPWIGKTLEVYVDDMLVKSKLRKDHHQDLRDIFEAMRNHNMKVNPRKMHLWSNVRKIPRILGNKKRHRGRPSQDKSYNGDAITKELERSAETQRIPSGPRKIHLKIFGQMQAILHILKKGCKFEWTAECEEAFEGIKKYLAEIPILQKPDPDEVLALYIAATDDAVSAVLVRTHTKEEQPIYYVSKTLKLCGEKLHKDRAANPSHCVVYLEAEDLLPDPRHPHPMPRTTRSHPQGGRKGRTNRKMEHVPGPVQHLPRAPALPEISSFGRLLSRPTLGQ